MADSSTPPNTLGLDFENLKIKESSDEPPVSQPNAEESAEGKSVVSDKPVTAPAVQATSNNVDPKTKKKPYVNPDRVKTGGAQRVRLHHTLYGCPLLIIDTGKTKR